ncbi:MAG: exonuclease domain-containing protein [bacterium]|nr:exonuclease domain-containing protein [bacterium]
MKLSEVSFVVLDTETTGLNPAFGDRIIELGMLKVKNRNIVDRFQSFINPGRPISPSATAINGITDEDVRFAPYFTQIVDQFLVFIADTVLIIHNAQFDLGFLAAQLRLAQKPIPQNPVFDTIRLAKLVYPHLGSYSLGNLATALNITIPHLHRAMNDVEITYQIFDNILTKLIQRNINTVDELLTFQGGTIPFPKGAEIPLPQELEEALKTNSKLKIRYISSSGEETVRLIEPIEINAFSDYLYLVAFCHLRKEKRTFRLDRIIQMLPVKTNDNKSGI